MSNILITGGAGSLGKAFVQLLHTKHNITVIDNNEWAVAEQQKEFPDVHYTLGDFANYSFAENPVDVIIHCAAYKHINLGEENVNEFIDNNIYKTQRLFKEASKYGADIIYISTDKAVEPCSLYGYTKAIGEYLTKAYNGHIVRLGNIVCSSGSVIPLWEDAIKRNEPIPITDERMVRYFIEDFVAVKLIWDGYLKGDKLIIPKCDKVRILDMLTDVLYMHGKTIDDVTIEIIGKRGIEKLEEKLKWEHEK